MHYKSAVVLACRHNNNTTSCLGVKLHADRRHKITVSCMCNFLQNFAAYKRHTTVMLKHGHCFSLKQAILHCMQAADTWHAVTPAGVHTTALLQTVTVLQILLHQAYHRGLYTDSVSHGAAASVPCRPEHDHRQRGGSASVPALPQAGRPGTTAERPTGLEEAAAGQHG